MSDNASNDGGDDDSQLWWTLFKYAAFIIGALVIVYWVVNLFLSLLPFLIVAGLLFFGYKIFIADDSSDSSQPAQDPPLLEHDGSDVVLDDDLEADPLEKKFEELERNS